MDAGPDPQELSMYRELASWWPLLSPPDDYAEEAAAYLKHLRAAARRPLERVLELGSGGGNNASHLKRHFEMTLVDVSPEMLQVSRALNPECEHIQGDMRTLRLGRTFDGVFIHDAICYMTTLADLAAAIETAAVHCAHGGSLVVAPDHVRETFAEGTDHGGSDGEGRGLRYLEWTHDPDPGDDVYTVDYAYLLRDGQKVEVWHDRHIEGLFPRATWLRVLEEAGFEAESAIAHLTDWGPTETFVGVRR
jgi:SAM-dependent methyltransferase